MIEQSASFLTCTSFYSTHCCFAPKAQKTIACIPSQRMPVQQKLSVRQLRGPNACTHLTLVDLTCKCFVSSSSFLRQRRTRSCMSVGSCLVGFAMHAGSLIVSVVLRLRRNVLVNAVQKDEANYFYKLRFQRLFNQKEKKHDF